MSAPKEPQQRVITLRGDPDYVRIRFPLHEQNPDQIFAPNRQTIEEDISQSQSHLDLFNEDLEHLRALEKEYVSARTHIINYIRLQKSALAPIRRLPREILAKIFLECKGTISILGRDAYVWKLCHVCSSWRQLAIALPALWNNISFREDSSGWKHRNDGWDPHTEPQNIGASTLELCLSRSAPLTLTLEICFDSVMPFDRLLRVSDRWQSVRIFWGKHDGRQPDSLLSSIRGQLPKLRHLMLEIPEFFSPEILQPFSEAPELTHLELSRGYPVGLDEWNEWSEQRLAPKLPWNQITHLTVKVKLPFAVHMTFMNLLSHLDTLIAPEIVLNQGDGHVQWGGADGWGDDGSDSGDDGLPPDISFYHAQVAQQPSLRILRINGNKANYILPALATPHLSELCLDVFKPGRREGLEQAAQSLSVHFRNYACPLRTLHITRYLDASFLNILFAGAPTVETLYLLPDTRGKNISSFRATFRTLTYTFETHNVTPLPNLQVLYLGNMPRANLGSVIEFIRSRNDVAPRIAEREKIPLACVPIRKFKLLHSEGSESMRHIKCWREDGSWYNDMEETGHDEDYSSLLELASPRLLDHDWDSSYFEGWS